MRQFKFRAWSNEHNRYCDFVTLDEDGRWIGWIKGSGVYLTTADIILEQYTGLKDNDGKEIYEGDVLWWEHYNGMNGKMYEHKAEVYYDEKLAEYFVSYADTSLGELIMEEEVYINTNIHENPELLGGKE